MLKRSWPRCSSAIVTGYGFSFAASSRARSFSSSAPTRPLEVPASTPLAAANVPGSGVVGAQADEEPVARSEVELRHVEHRVMEARQAIEREHADHAGECRDEH